MSAPAGVGDFGRQKWWCELRSTNKEPPRERGFFGPKGSQGTSSPLLWTIHRLWTGETGQKTLINQYGAGRETRTLTMFPSADFESAASTDSAIPARSRSIAEAGWPRNSAGRI